MVAPPSEGVEQQVRQRQPHRLSGVSSALLITFWRTKSRMQKKTGVMTMKTLVQTARRCCCKFLRRRAFA